MHLHVKIHFIANVHINIEIEMKIISMIHHSRKETAFANRSKFTSENVNTNIY